MPVLQVAPSSGQNRLSSSSHGGATEWLFKWPSSGQNWLSSSSHGGATERCQVFKWRHLPDKTGYHLQVAERCHLPDKTGYHHHHMVAVPGIQVAPSFGQNWLSSSSHGGATERCQVFKWRHLSDKTGHHHHHHMVAPLSGASAIFRTKLVIIIITWWRH